MRGNEVGAEPDNGLEAHPAGLDAGTLVIRTWHEYGAQPPAFRARITYGPALGHQQTTVSAADPDKVLHVVREWLLGQSTPPGGH